MMPVLVAHRVHGCPEPRDWSVFRVLFRRIVLLRDLIHMPLPVLLRLTLLMAAAGVGRRGRRDVGETGDDLVNGSVTVPVALELLKGLELADLGRGGVSRRA